MKTLLTIIFVGKGQKFAKPQKYLLVKISSFKANCWNQTLLTLPAPCISESCIKIKIKAFIKPFEAPQRSVKIKISVNFFSLSGMEAGRVKTSEYNRV